MPSILSGLVREQYRRELKMKYPDKAAEKIHMIVLLFVTFLKMYSDQLASLTISTELKLKIFLK